MKLNKNIWKFGINNKRIIKKTKQIQFNLKKNFKKYLNLKANNLSISILKNLKIKMMIKEMMISKILFQNLLKIGEISLDKLKLQMKATKNTENT